VFDQLKQWLDEELRSENAKAVMCDAAEILSEDGPLAATDIQARLFDRHPDAYSSAEGL